MPSTFDPFELEQAKRLTGNDLDRLPFGVIVVDRAGTILEYNAYEREMAGAGGRQVIGSNFFRDVAPCTAIKEFEGRFEAFLDSEQTSVEPFQFVFPFPRGRQRVTVVFVRLANDASRATICVVRATERAATSLPD